MRALMLSSLIALTLNGLSLPNTTYAADRDERRSEHREGNVRSEERGAQSVRSESPERNFRDNRSRDNSPSPSARDGREDRRSDRREDRREDWRDDRREDRRNDWRDQRRPDVIVEHRDQHRHSRDYDPRPDRWHDHRRSDWDLRWKDHWNDGWRHTHSGPRRVIVVTDHWGRHRDYHLQPDYYSHFYDPFYFRNGTHFHVGCRYHDFWDAVAAGVVIGAILGDW